MKNVYKCMFLMLFMSVYMNAQDEPTAAFDTEVEVESEVEAEVGVGQAAGTVSLSAGAGANFPNAKSAVMLSGGLAQMIYIFPDPGKIIMPGTLSLKKPNSMHVSSGNRATDNNIFLAEGEAEVESEVEVEVGEAAAVATAGTAVGAAGVAASKYTVDNGDVKLWPTNSVTAVMAKSSVSAKTSEVNIDYPADNPTPVEGSGTGAGRTINDDLSNSDNDEDTTSREAQDLPYGVVYATEDDQPLSQIETDTETEVEVEAEAEAETTTGAAGAGATGGSATVVAGDYGVAVAGLSVITSVSASTVNDVEPVLFNIPEPASNSEENTGSGNENIPGGGGRVQGSAISLNPRGALLNAQELANVPDDVNGKGLNNFETEAESEVEVEAETDNGAAAVAVISAGGTGANGVAASVTVTSTSAASTSTEFENGVAVRENDQIFFSEDRYLELDEAQPISSAEAEAEAEANAEVPVPFANGTANGVAAGDAIAFGDLVIADIDTQATRSGFSEGKSTSNRNDFKLREEIGLRAKDASEFSYVSLNVESENEAEVEAEAEAETGFNAAAAGAGASAVQGKNGVLPFDSQASSSSSTSTKVFDGEEQVENEDLEFVPSGDTVYPDFGIDFTDYEYEAETEAEAEAEVGFNAAAVAVSAAAAGYPGIQISTAYETNPYAAAGAAAAGAVVTTSITMPANGEAGEVSATATAQDDENRGVAVAVAVAGVSTENGVENEEEQEAEDPTFATVTVTIFTDPANAANPVLLGGYSSSTNPDSADEEGSQQGILGEAEAEAESEAEAGYGVAAASAAAGAAGIDAKSEAFTATSTLDYTGGFDFTDNLFAITDAGISRNETTQNVELIWNGFGYTQFSIQQQDSNGDFVEIGTVDRVNDGIWELYKFTVSNVANDVDQTFKIVPLENPDDEVILTLAATDLAVDDFDTLQIGIYPNPVNDILNITFKNNQGPVDATLIDLTGKIVERFTIDALAGQTEQYQPNAGLSNGIYILNLTSAEASKSFRVILQR